MFVLLIILTYWYIKDIFRSDGLERLAGKCGIARGAFSFVSFSLGEQRK